MSLIASTNVCVWLILLWHKCLRMCDKEVPGMFTIFVSTKIQIWACIKVVALVVTIIWMYVCVISQLKFYIISFIVFRCESIQFKVCCVCPLFVRLGMFFFCSCSIVICLSHRRMCHLVDNIAFHFPKTPLSIHVSLLIKIQWIDHRYSNDNVNDIRLKRWSKKGWERHFWFYVRWKMNVHPNWFH